MSGFDPRYERCAVVICKNCLGRPGVVYAGSRLLCGVCFLYYANYLAAERDRTKPTSYMDTERKIRREAKRYEVEAQ